jgi:transposase
LFPPSIEDRVGGDHLVRHLKGLVEKVAGSDLRRLYDDKGGVAYDPVSLLCVELYGLMLGIRSSRQLEELCRYDARFWFLTGELVPDHNTLARFRHRLADHLPEIFARTLDEARAQGILGMRVVAVDGTKVEGNVSQWKKIVSEASQVDAASDPDARDMRSGRGSHLLGYNAQVGVDVESGLIVGEVVTQAQNDAHAMPEILDSIEELGRQLPEVVVADGGYDSTENHVELSERGVRGVINPQGRRDSFWRLDEDGRARCPAGHTPRFRGQFKKGSKLYDAYLVGQCPTCPLRPGCVKSGYKKLTAPAGLPPASRLENAARANSPDGRYLLRRRKSWIELVFAQMKGNMGFRRFRTRGLERVQAEFTMECIAYNARKLLKGAFQALICLYERFTASISQTHWTPSNRRRRTQHLGLLSLWVTP